MNEKRRDVWFSILLVVISGFVFFSLGVTVAWKWGFPNGGSHIEYPVYYENKTTSTTVAFAGLVNLNTATVDELMLIEGIGEKTAQNIIEYRESIGQYTFVEQLLDVEGIGETKLNRWKPYLIVDTVTTTDGEAFSTTSDTSRTTTVTTTTAATTTVSTVISTTTTTVFDGVLNLNTATKEELMQIKGIGEITALKIIEYREAIGGFTALEQLMNIDGIGEKKFAAWCRYFTLDE